MATFLEKNCSFGIPYVFFLMSIWSLIASHFGFEGGTLVLGSLYPGHCLSFTCKLLSHVDRSALGFRQ